jgi:hypothetical protein
MPFFDRFLWSIDFHIGAAKFKPVTPAFAEWQGPAFAEWRYKKRTRSKATASLATSGAKARNT